MVILDEADEMLDMGFRDDLEFISQRNAESAPDGILLGDHAEVDFGPDAEVSKRTRSMCRLSTKR
jgi:superfamily II DNA/RNA helicase